MPKNGVFIVRFRTNDDNEKTIVAGTKPLIVKRWNPEMDLNAEDVKVVPTWVRLLRLPLKYQGQSTLNKLARFIGNPIKTDKATAQKEILAYAKILMEVSI